MITHVNSFVVLDAVLAAAKGYVNIVTDHDPDEGDFIVASELRRFLARLRLLQGVPFSYLVPDIDLLPIESIRFFYIDRAWTDALIQGVLSIGTITTANRAQLEAVYPNIRADVDKTERTIREASDNSLLQGPGGTITGFLMRSRLVSGWPNMHVRAYLHDELEDDLLTDKAESAPDRLKVLRMERLAPAVLFVLFDGVPAVVHIEEPRQGIQFGVRLDKDAPPDQRTARVHVRDNETGMPIPPVKELTTANSVPVPFRPGAPGVLDLAKLRERLSTEVYKQKPDDDDTGILQLQPNEYALQMLRFPFRQVFGDPDNQQEDQKFYDLDKFKPTISLALWKDNVQKNLDRVSNESR